MIQIDMNMPSNCQECRFLFDTLYDGKTHYYCHAMELPLCEEDVTGRPECCPLQEVSNNVLNDEESQWLLDFISDDVEDTNNTCES